MTQGQQGRDLSFVLHVCCSPAPSGGCCRCCSSPIQTQALQP
ncbi:hypothetical protein AMTRI_Chr01g130850 [Amborella trichopoda]